MPTEKSPADDCGASHHTTATEQADTAKRTATLAGLARRREASRRLMPLCCGCRDPLVCRHRDRLPVVRLSLALGALRRAWSRADPADRKVLRDVADVLRATAKRGAA
jgi:hypothetical protein